MKVGALYRGEHCVVPTVWYAANPWTRLRGLLGRKPLMAGQGLLLEPCSDVHTFGMRYALDLVFLSQDNRVLALRESVAPWSACGRRGARKTLELAAGGAAVFAPRVGEELLWRAF